MNLPIELIPNSNPPKFRWRQTLPGGNIVRQSGSLPPNVEQAVVDLIKLAEDRLEEILKLRKQVDGMCDRIAAQSEVIAKQAEKVEKTDNPKSSPPLPSEPVKVPTPQSFNPPPHPPKKSK